MKEIKIMNWQNYTQNVYIECGIECKFNKLELKLVTLLYILLFIAILHHSILFIMIIIFLFSGEIL